MRFFDLSQQSTLKRKHIALLLTSAGLTLAGCGGGSDTTAPPPAPTITVDVFGARGGILTAVVNTTNCSSTPVLSWATTGGTTLGNTPTVTDTQPNSSIIATASCSTAIASQTLLPKPVLSTNAAFATLQGGQAFAWGNPVWGGQTKAAQAITNIAQIYPSDRGFAALLTDGTARAWGSSFVAVSDPNNSPIATGPLTNIATIIPGRVGFFGVKKDGSFVAWGFYRAVAEDTEFAFNDPANGLSAPTLASLTNITGITSNESSYAALKADGTVVAFGDAPLGGDASGVTPPLSNVQQIVATDYDFIARRKDGTVSVWPGNWAAPATGLNWLTNVANLAANGSVGVATLANGTAYGFGFAPDVEAADTSILNSNSMLTNVTNVYATQTAFAALRADGTVVAWGDQPRMLAGLLNAQGLLTNVKAIQNTEYAFAAMKGDGSVVAWGDANVGGDTSAVAKQLTNVISISSNKYAFAALKSDGSVVAWGMPSKGGDTSAVASQLTNVRAIYSTPFGAFLAIKKDGTFVTWGDQWAGGTGAPAGLTTIPYAK